MHSLENHMILVGQISPQVDGGCVVFLATTRRFGIIADAVPVATDSRDARQFPVFQMVRSMPSAIGWFSGIRFARSVQK